VSAPEVGFVEWFRPGERDRVEEVVAELAAAGATRLRTHVSWAEFHTEGGPAWFDWLIPTLGRAFDLLPCVHYTPPSLSRTGRTSGPPHDLKTYADFIDGLLTRHGAHFSHVELWNEPNNLLDWDWREDQDYLLFCEMAGAAAHWVRERGWKAVLGGPCPFDPLWLDLMGERGLLQLCAAVGFHGFPGTWDSEEAGWHGWDMHLGEMRAVLDRWNPEAEIWVTETGYSTWRNDEMEQARRFAHAMEAKADRLYWYGWRDLPPDVPVQEGLWFDPRHYHMGAVTAGGQPKLLARLLTAGGVARVGEITRLAAPRLAPSVRPAAVTGGAGFIGANLADALLNLGEEVLILDNLSRAGVEDNLSWLVDRHGARVHFVPSDLRQETGLAEVVAEASSVFHLAAQTAVTTSLVRPVDDFEVNARGTVNLLEAVRATGRPVPVVYAGTNKVYGALSDVVMADGERHLPAIPALRRHGLAEDRPLDFCTPYGCSKGVADQYVLDYAASYGLPTAVLRMSCIYGPRQFGTEDQGWVAHFAIRALEGREIAIFGDGRQVRDILHVSDAVAAYLAVRARIAELKGRAFNLGGGTANAVSLRDVLAEIGRITGRTVKVSHHGWRPGDQPWFVADTRALSAATGWRAEVGWRAGLRDLTAWLASSRGEAPTASRPRRRA
jgi:CDP-paratose 2-epimerase